MQTSSSTTAEFICAFACKFTGKERDSESGLDYFGARYYGSSMGRFMSPDWSAKAEPVPYAKLDNPQSLNLYSYVGNNPLSRVDADGHCSSPSVGKGQVGVCVDLYIQAATLPKAVPLGLAFGDGRGPAPNDASASYRVELQFVITPGAKDGVSMTKNDGGTSVAMVGGVVAAGKGTSETSMSKPTIDDNGTEHFSVNNTALNGLHNAPGAPQDTIKTTLNFAVTADGKVGFDAGGSRTAYPSIEVYSYGANGSVNTIYQKTESGNLNDLQHQNQPIPAVTPQ